MNMALNCCTCAEFFAPFLALFKALLLQHPGLLFAFLLHYFDIVTDVTLGISYLLDGHLIWGCLTLFFAALPLFFAIVVSHVSLNHRRFFDSVYDVGRLFAVLGLLPIASKLKAKVTNDPQERIFSKRVAAFMVYLELLMETIPQLVLQMYIVSQTEAISLLTWLTIVSSLLSISFNGVQNQVILIGFRNDIRPRMTATKARHLVAVALSLPWVLGEISSLFPSIALRLSIQTNVEPWSKTTIRLVGITAILSFAAFFSHIIILSLLTHKDAFPSQYSDSGTPRLQLFGTVAGVVIQILTCVFIWLYSTSWFLYFAPFLPSSSVAFIPDFIWPNTLPIIRRLASNNKYFAFEDPFDETTTFTECRNVGHNGSLQCRLCTREMHSGSMS